MFVKVVGSEAMMMSGSMKIVPENGGAACALWPAMVKRHNKISPAFFIAMVIKAGCPWRWILYVQGLTNPIGKPVAVEFDDNASLQTRTDNRRPAKHKSGVVPSP